MYKHTHTEKKVRVHPRLAKIPTSEILVQWWVCNPGRANQNILKTVKQMWKVLPLGSGDCGLRDEKCCLSYYI